MPTYVAFSHLRWDFVYQRPQHLLSRIARRHPVFYVEEPVHDDGEPWLERRVDESGVIVLRPHTNIAAPGFHDEQLPALRSLFASTFADLERPCAWLYTPMALPLLADLPAGTVVYDCMDELSAFLHAPRQLRQREHALLQRADLVFTGGRSLFEAKRGLHADVHCFPSSVDVGHFALAASATPTKDGRPPRLGYFGVVDERFDVALLTALADAEPDWAIEIVGPVVKIDPASLPQRSNIRYAGLKPYAELPAIIADWDVCLMPFAINEATRYISPTKVLEYMAAGKAIVSTPIHDVVVPYGAVVAIAADAEAFVAACRRALDESPAQRNERRLAMAAIVEATSWEGTVGEMLALVAGADHAAARAVDAMPTSHDAATPVETRPRLAASSAIDEDDSYDHVGTAVIGAGPTGLSAAYHLSGDARLFERGPVVGGWCRSIVQDGFTFDHAGHIMFSKDPVVHALYKTLLGDNVHWQDREAWVYSYGVYTRYPFQGALYGLPPEVLKECLVGAIEARFGSIDGTMTAVAPMAAAMPATADAVLAVKVAENDDCCGDGEHARPDTRTGEGKTAVVLPMSLAPRNFEEFIYRTWGAGVAKHFALPYNRKLWAVPLTSMETSWLGGRVPLPDLAEMIDGALQPVMKPVGPNAVFGYPLRGGFQALMDGFLPHIGHRLECNADVAVLDVEGHRFELADGRRYAYDQMVSTMPLPELVKLIGDGAPDEVRAAADGLRHVSVRCVNLGIGRADITEKHWIYYPGDTVFHRIFVQANTSPHCNPEGGFGLTCEITHNASKPLPCEGEALIRRCFDDCVRVGLLRADDVLLTANEVEMEYAYVVYDHARANNVAVIRDWLAQHDILLAGRYSEWEYYNSDHAFLAGKRIAERVESLQMTKEASRA